MARPIPISRTAQAMALFRALEAAKRRDRRLFDDPFAASFLPAAWKHIVGLSRAGLIGGLIERFIDWRWPGARSSGAARTRLIDDWLADALRNGVTQVVILGAGFDCRSQRLSSLSAIKIFELDREAILIRKKNILTASAPSAGDHVTYAPIDFLHDDIRSVLGGAGFREGAKTVVLWEGVTHYLQSEAVCRVFNTIAKACAPGSVIIFTYIHKAVLEGRFEAPGLVRLQRQLNHWGEPWTFGFYPEQLPPFLRDRGFELTRDVGAAQYRERYFGARARRLSGYEFYRVACARLISTET